MLHKFWPFPSIHSGNSRAVELHTLFCLRSFYYLFIRCSICSSHLLGLLGLLDFRLAHTIRTPYVRDMCSTSAISRVFFTICLPSMARCTMNECSELKNCFACVYNFFLSRLFGILVYRTICSQRTRLMRFCSCWIHRKTTAAES